MEYDVSTTKKIVTAVIKVLRKERPSTRVTTHLRTELQTAVRDVLVETGQAKNDEAIHASRHVCGVQGFDGMVDTCPGCAAHSAPRPTKASELYRAYQSLQLHQESVDGAEEK